MSTSVKKKFWNDRKLTGKMTGGCEFSHMDREFISSTSHYMQCLILYAAHQQCNRLTKLDNKAQIHPKCSYKYNIYGLEIPCKLFQRLKDSKIEREVQRKHGSQSYNLQNHCRAITLPTHPQHTQTLVFAIEMLTSNKVNQNSMD